MINSPSSSSLFFLALAIPTILAAAPALAQQPNGADFILTSCSRTLYPALCYSSLSPYSNSTRNNPARLAHAAIRVSLTEARLFASRLSDLWRRVGANEPPQGPGAAVAALRDCLATMADAVSQMHISLETMRQLMAGGGGGARGGEGYGFGFGFGFGMSNVQTWMSTALTDEETCVNGFGEVGDDGGEVKKEVGDGVEVVKMVTSNALALVNNCARKGSP